MRTTPFVGATTLLLLAVAAPSAAQVTQRHDFPEYGFSIDVPARWAEMPEPLVAAFDSSMARREAADVRTVAGFQMAASPHRLAPPYVVVRVQRVAPLTREELAAAAMAPARLLGLRGWLDYVAESYGRNYSLNDFTWDDSDAIFWMASSGAEDPYPDVATITAAVAFDGVFVLAAYRTFPSTDLKVVRDSLRDMLLSVRPLPGANPDPVPARAPLRPQQRPQETPRASS